MCVLALIPKLGGQSRMTFLLIKFYVHVSIYILDVLKTYIYLRTNILMFLHNTTSERESL